MLHPTLTPRRNGSVSGTGLFTSKAIRRGELLWKPEPRWPLESLAGLRALGPTERTYSQIDADCFAASGPPEWLMNHSCEPNGKMRDRAIYALRDIQAGEEITYDYGVTEITLGWRFRCTCGSAGCRRIVTNHDYLLSGCFQQSPAYAQTAAQAASPWFKLKFRIWHHLKRIQTRGQV